MAGRSLFKTTHEACGSKSLQIFQNDDGTRSGFCFACAKKIKLTKDQEDHEVPIPTAEELAEQLDIIRNSDRWDTDYRGISAATYKKFGCRKVYSEYTGELYAIAFPYTKDGKVCGFKVRTLEGKQMWSVGVVADADMFGWLVARKVAAKKLIITEGEYDALSVWECSQQISKGTPYADIPVVSINGGVSSAVASIDRLADDIDQLYDDVALMFDSDMVGQQAATKVARAFPDVLNILLGGKDANEMLQEGKLKSLHAAFSFKAAKKDKTTTLSVDDLIDEALQPVVMGKSYPWEGMTELTYGQQEYQVVSIGGGVGSGKSLLAYELVAWNAEVHDETSYVVFMEETPAKALKNICGKIDSIPYHVPELVFDQDAFRATAQSLMDKVTFWSPKSRGTPDETWKGIKKEINSKQGAYKNIVLDNMTTLSAGLSSTEINEFINTVANDCADMAVQWNCRFWILSHLNPYDKSSRQHEQGAKVLESQFTGSRALMRYSHYMIGFQRNKYAIDPNCSYISVVKDRDFGKTGNVKTYYYPTTGRLVQRNWDDESFADVKIGEVNKRGNTR